MNPPPDDEAVYTLEIVARITGVATGTILHYKEQGLIHTLADSGEPGHFDDDALRTLRRIEHLRTTYGVNEPGVKLILGLMDELERSRHRH